MGTLKNWDFRVWNSAFGGLDQTSIPPGHLLCAQTAASTFQEDLSTYLDRLRLPAAATAKMWEDIRDHDFGAARVALIPSVPGYHSCTGAVKRMTFKFLAVRSL